MIKKITVAICDICGFTEQAKPYDAGRNETDYTLPDKWGRGQNKDFCICPKCAGKIGIGKPTVNFRGRDEA